MLGKVIIWTVTLIGTMPVLTLAIVHLALASTVARDSRKEAEELIAREQPASPGERHFFSLGTTWTVGVSGRELQLHFRPWVSVLAIVGVIAIVLFVAFTLHVRQKA